MIGRDRERDGFAGGDVRLGKKRQRQQEPDQQRKAGDLPVIRIADRPAPRELRHAACVEQTPVGTDAAFVGLPGLVEGFDQVVVDAIGFGAREEVTDDQRLLDAAGDCALVVVARTRPAELGDDDPLARMQRGAARRTA